MTSHYRRGKDAEYRVRDHLGELGWLLVAQTGGSHGPADLVMVSAEQGIALIQVKRKGVIPSPGARAALIALARYCGALPIVATVIPYSPIHYQVVDEGRPGSWVDWSPQRNAPF